MPIRILTILLCGLAVLSCKYNKKGKQSKSIENQDPIQATDSTPISLIQWRDTVVLDSFILISEKSKLEIITIGKHIDSLPPNVSSFERNKLECAEWSLSKNDVKHILLTSRSADAQELHYYYNEFPCYYEGLLNIDGKRAAYAINAGAFSVIDFKDTSITLGYKLEDNKKYFLTGRATD